MATGFPVRFMQRSYRYMSSRFERAERIVLLLWIFTVVECGEHRF